LIEGNEKEGKAGQVQNRLKGAKSTASRPPGRWRLPRLSGYYSRDIKYS